MYQVTKDHMIKKRMIEIEAKRESCALTIQTYFRSHSRLQKFLNFRKAVIRLQAAFRGGKIRKTNKINRALNIVEDKKRLEREVKELRQRVAQLETTVEERNKTVSELEENSGNLFAELSTTKDQLSSVKASRKKASLPLFCLFFLISFFLLLLPRITTITTTMKISSWRRRPTPSPPS